MTRMAKISEREFWGLESWQLRSDARAVLVALGLLGEKPSDAE